MAEAAVRQGLAIAVSTMWMPVLLASWISLGCSGHPRDVSSAASPSEPAQPTTTTYPIPEDLVVQAAASGPSVDEHKEPPGDEHEQGAPPADAQRTPPRKAVAGQHSDARRRTAPSIPKRVVASSTPTAPATVPARRSADPVPSRPPAETDSRRRIPLVDDSARVRIVD